MIDITKHIKDLLFLHDSVTLPNFGSFVTDYRSARINKQHNVFSPPFKEIKFNRELLQKDDLLINRLIEAEKISRAEAKKSVTLYLEDILVKINRGERVVLEGIGFFFNDKKSNLQFKPDRNANFLTDAIGMKSFSLPLLSGRERIRDYSTAFHWMRYMLVFIPALVAFAIFPLKTNRNRVGGFVNKPVVKVEIKNNSHSTQIPAPEISDKNELVYYDPSAETIKPVGDIMPTRKGKYYLIAGSFTSLKNAKIFRQKLETHSYPAVIVRNKTLYSVAVNTFDTRKAASQYQKRFIANNPEISCWIFRK